MIYLARGGGAQAFAPSAGRWRRRQSPLHGTAALPRSRCRGIWEGSGLRLGLQPQGKIWAGFSRLAQPNITSRIQ
jgi:hypothetical protein